MAKKIIVKSLTPAQKNFIERKAQLKWAYMQRRLTPHHYRKALALLKLFPGDFWLSDTLEYDTPLGKLIQYEVLTYGINNIEHRQITKTAILQ